MYSVSNDFWLRSIRVAAQRVAKFIRDGVKILSHQPKIGRPAEDMEPEYREWLYRVVPI